MNVCLVASHDVRRATLHRAARVPFGLVVAGITVLATACGGVATSSGTTPQQRIQQLNVFASCMRSHGVPNFYFISKQNLPSSVNPDTSPVLGFMGYYVVGVNPQTAAFWTAMSACKHLMPGGAPPPITQQQKDRMLRAAACMRSHGYPDYPDPVFKNGGVDEQPLPSDIDPDSQQFLAARKACGA